MKESLNRFFVKHSRFHPRLSNDRVHATVLSTLWAYHSLCGLMTQHSANAQWGDYGEQMLNKAKESGGVLGSVAQLGSAITDMEKNVNGLQQNLDILKKVQAALGGK